MALIKVKSKTARKIISILTFTVGGWFIFEFVMKVIAGIVISPIWSLIVGILLVMVGIKGFGLKLWE